MEAIVWIVTAAVVFALCRLVDKGFQKLFRNKAEHLSGLAVRVNKRYGVFGIILSAIGIAAMVSGSGSDKVLLWGGLIVLVLGVSFAVYYLSFGIFYGEDSFLVSSLGRKSDSYRYSDIVGQKLYLITGGNVVVELQMSSGKTVSLQSTMDGVYPFLDAAFSGCHWEKKASTPRAAGLSTPERMDSWRARAASKH